MHNEESKSIIERRICGKNDNGITVSDFEFCGVFLLFARHGLENYDSVPLLNSVRSTESVILEI